MRLLRAVIQTDAVGLAHLIDAFCETIPRSPTMTMRSMPKSSRNLCTRA